MTRRSTSLFKAFEIKTYASWSFFRLHKHMFQVYIKESKQENILDRMEDPVIKSSLFKNGLDIFS